MDKRWLSDRQFKDSVQILPLISIDLCVISGGSILLGKRNNKPAEGWWFTPGGRILKGEPFNLAIRRIATNELGSDDLLLNGISLMGVWDHFYDNSAFDDSISTHYVNLPHYCVIDSRQQMKLCLPEGNCEQHSDWRWQSLESVGDDSSVHLYVRKYSRWLVNNLVT